MPLAKNALTTLQNMKSFLKIPSDQTNDDQMIEALINSASSAIEGYCKRQFIKQIYTDEEYDGNGSSGLYLRQYPIESITSVSVNDQLLSNTEYKIKKDNGKLIRKSGCWPPGEINIAVTYTAGYSEVPADLEHACKALVMTFFKADIQAFSTTFQDGFAFRPEALPAQVKMLVSPYKKVM